MIDTLSAISIFISEDWKAIGAALEENGAVTDSRGTYEDFYPAKLIQKDRLTHNVFLFTFELANSAVIGVPVGFHLRIRLNRKRLYYTA
jgi:hypothetical protein